MAKSTCDPNATPPKGMQKFEVIRSTIKDCLGQYCEPGDLAVLNKDLAQGYLDKNFIRVALPEFDEDENDQASDESTTNDSAGADATERTEASSNTGKRTRKRGTRASADS